MRVVLLAFIAQLCLLAQNAAVPVLSGATLPATCFVGELFFKTNESAGSNSYGCTSANVWTLQGGGTGSGLPTGAIILITAGTCPTGYAEATELNGVMVRGTLAANGDVGTAGGSDSITPVGTVSQPTFAGNALAGHAHGAGSYSAAAQSFTGTPFSGVINHTHPVSSLTGTIPTRASAGSTLTSASGIGATGGTGTAPVTFGGSIPNPTGGVASITPAGTNASSAVSGSSSSDSAGTPSGTVSQPTFAGTAFDNRPAYLKVIFCKKT